EGEGAQVQDAPAGAGASGVVDHRRIGNLHGRAVGENAPGSDRRKVAAHDAAGERQRATGDSAAFVRAVVADGDPGQVNAASDGGQPAAGACPVARDAGICDGERASLVADCPARGARFVPGQPALIRDPHGAAVVGQPAAVDAGNVAVDVAVSERDRTCGCVGDAAAVAISRVLLDKAAVHGQLTSVGDTATVPARGTA